MGIAQMYSNCNFNATQEIQNKIQHHYLKIEQKKTASRKIERLSLKIFKELLHSTQYRTIHIHTVFLS
jgi:hypothetical protein